MLRRLISLASDVLLRIRIGRATLTRQCPLVGLDQRETVACPALLLTNLTYPVMLSRD